MKILFIVPRFKPEIGGVEKHACSVIRELTTKGNVVEVLTFSKKKNLEPFEIKNRVLVHRIIAGEKRNDRGNFLLNLFQIWFYLLKNFRLFTDPDIIHLHDYQTFLWIVPFLPLIKKPVYITYHGLEAFPIPRFSKLMRQISTRTTKGNICVGKFICKWYGTLPDYVTIGGVDILHSSANNSEETGVFIGRLEKDTGILSIIEALKILKEKYAINLPLHICGEGSLRGQIVDYANKNELKLILHGSVTNPQHYLLASRFAFVSGYLSILEAMSCQRPVISIYNNPLKRDYFYSIPDTDNLMILSTSPEQMVASLLFVMKNHAEIDLMVKKAYYFALEQSWNKVADLYLKLYQK